MTKNQYTRKEVYTMFEKLYKKIEYKFEGMNDVLQLISDEVLQNLEEPVFEGKFENGVFYLIRSYYGGNFVVFRMENKLYMRNPGGNGQFEESVDGAWEAEQMYFGGSEYFTVLGVCNYYGKLVKKEEEING